MEPGATGEFLIHHGLLSSLMGTLSTPPKATAIHERAQSIALNLYCRCIVQRSLLFVNGFPIPQSRPRLLQSRGNCHCEPPLFRTMFGSNLTARNAGLRR